MQNEEKIHLRVTIDEKGKTKQGEPENWDGILECFERISAGSACPNTAKGIFINFEQTLTFLSSFRGKLTSRKNLIPDLTGGGGGG